MPVFDQQDYRLNNCGVEDEEGPWLELFGIHVDILRDDDLGAPISQLQLGPEPAVTRIATGVRRGKRHLKKEDYPYDHENSWYHLYGDLLRRKRWEREDRLRPEGHYTGLGDWWLQEW